jgi:hypothetical protein
MEWKDYEVSVDVHVGNKGFAGVYGRLNDVATWPAPGGYGLIIDNTGAWKLKNMNSVLESGKVDGDSDSWHNLKLRFKGIHVIGVIDGHTVCHITDGFRPKGPAGLVSGFNAAEFDNFSVKPFKRREPKPVPAYENLALGAKATASSQLRPDAGPEKVIDGDHKTGWCHTAHQSSDEWLEIDLGKDVTFDRTLVDQHLNDEHAAFIKDYKIQYWDGADWKDAYTGSDMTSCQVDSFPQVTARKVRLLITSMNDNNNDSGCVYEFQVYRHKR